MKVCIKEKEFNPSLLSQEWCDEQKAIEMGYTIVEAPNDCAADDFVNLQFSQERYNARKNKENNGERITKLKGYLLATDYKAIKYAEGELSAEEYEPVKEQRRQWRAEINSLE